MATPGQFLFVFVAGLITALATGFGAFPFFVVDEFSDRWTVALWGVASGIMTAASLFGLLVEGLAEAADPPTLLVGGLVVGGVLVEVADRALDRVDLGDGAGHHDADTDAGGAGAHGRTDAYAGGGHAGSAGDEHAHDGGTASGHDHHVDPALIASGELRTLVLVLGVLTVHSFPEGVAIGVSFAELGFEGGVSLLGFTVPLLAIVMTIAISIHNIPEGLAIAIPMRVMGVNRWRMVGAAVFSSLPQPIGAVIAFFFVRAARSLLPFGFGFAAGAMLYLVVTEFVPEALETGESLPGGGYRELAVGTLAGVVAMLPLLLV